MKELKMPKRTNLKKLKEMYEKSKPGSRNFSTSFWYPPDEENIIRILPPVEDKEVFYKETGSHRFGDYFFWCPRLTEGKKCPICEERRRRYESGTELDREIATKLKGKKKYIYNIVDRKGEDPTKVIQYITGPKVWEKILSYYFDEEYGALDDVEKGYDFKLIKKMVSSPEGEFANYDDSRPMKNPSRLAETDEEIAEILSNLVDLDTIINLKDYDIMKAALEDYLAEFYNIEVPETEESTQKAEPEIKTKPKTKKDKLKSEPTPIMEEDDEEEQDIDEFEAKLMKELAEDDDDE